MRSTALAVQPIADKRSLAPLVRNILESLGEDPGREGLRGTPDRVEKALKFLSSGYTADVKKLVNGALFEAQYDEMVGVRDIEFYSLCEHHMLPFFGRIHVAYVPDGKVIGLSKIPRIVDALARKLQIQERFTQQVAEAIAEVTGAAGAAAICEARHFCMMMRGVEKQHSSTTTTARLGKFRDDTGLWRDFLSMAAGQPRQR